MEIRLVAVVSGSGESAELLEEQVRKLLPSAQILIVSEGSNAAETISEQRPDLILVDTMSAGKAGFAIGAKLKQDERISTIPQICLYSPDSRDSRIMAHKSGADGLLPWPPDNDEFSAIARNLVKRMEKHKKQLAHLKNSISESERLYDLLLNNIELISVTLDRHGRITFCNDYLLNITGWQREDILGANWFEIFIPPEAGDIKLKFSDLRNDVTSSWHNENEILTRSGERRLISWKNSVLMSADGTVAGTASIGEDITERKQIENALIESEQKYRSFFENSMDAILLTFPDGSVLAANPAACRMFGRTEKEIIKLGRSGLVDNSDPRLQVLLAERDKTGRTEGELYCLRKDGTRFHAEITSAIYYDIGGSQKTSMIIRDITQRKQQEDKLREKDQQFRKLSANMHDFIFQFTRNTDGTYIVPVASEGIKNIFGCSPEDVINDFSPIVRVIHPEDVEKVISDIEYSARNLSYFTCEFRVQRPGHPMQWIFSRSTPEKLPDGSVTWYGFNADITYRKQVEEALRESEGKFRKIYEEGPYGMALINSERRFVMANRTFCHILGYDESELQNMTFYDITHPDDRDAGLEIHSKLVARETDVVRSEKRYLRKDGSVIWASITVTSNYDDAGVFTFILAIIEDITERRLASEQIVVLNERLSYLVEAIQELSTSATLEGIMKTVMDSARRLLSADGATFALRDKDLCYYADEDAISPLWKGQRYPMDKCVSGWVMENRQAVIIEDVYSNDLIPHEIYLSTFVRSLSIAPIRQNNPLGAIGAYWSTNVTPSTAELQLLQTLADAAAKAVENVQLIEGLERTISDRTADLQAVNRAEAEVIKMKESLEMLNRHLDEIRESERAALARELHDQLGQSLTALKIDVNYLHDKMAGSSEEQSKLELMSGMITEMIRDVQRIASDLRPPVLDDLGLVSAMEWYIRDFEKRTGVECRANLDSIQFPIEKKNLTLYRILQEALTNVSRHAGAKKVEISLTRVFNLVSFEVADDGTGFDTDKIDSFSSLGFIGIRERLKQHNGLLEIETAPGKGTRLIVMLPFNEKQAQ